MGLQLGLVSATFREQSTEFVINACRENGVLAIEWTENAHVFRDDIKGAALVYQKTADSGLQVAAYSSYYRLGMQPLTDAPDVFRAVMASAISLHAPMIRVWAGTKPSCEVDEGLRKTLVQELRLIAGMAENEGLKIALEWHKNTLTDTNPSAFHLLDEVEMSNVYCLWQPTAALSMSERINGLRELQRREKLLNLHMYHWQDEERRPLKEGLDEWSQYLRVLNKEAARYCLLEFVAGNSYEQFISDVEVAKEILSPYQ